MSNLSQFFSGGVTEIGESHAHRDSAGWLVDEANNTSGMIITNLAGWHGSGSGGVYVTDSSTSLPSSRLILRVQSGNSSAVMGAIKIPAGFGLYTQGSVDFSAHYTLL